MTMNESSMNRSGMIHKRQMTKNEIEKMCHKQSVQFAEFGVEWNTNGGWSKSILKIVINRVSSLQNTQYSISTWNHGFSTAYWKTYAVRTQTTQCLTYCTPGTIHESIQKTRSMRQLIIERSLNR
jgi:hypothetical protein